MDDTIREIQAEPDLAKHIMQQVPEMHVFELDGRFYSVNNRRLFVYKVLSCMGILDNVVARLLPRDDPMLQRQKYDWNRKEKAPKWERHLSSRTSGFVVYVTGRSSRFANQQALPPSRYWRCRR